MYKLIMPKEFVHTVFDLTPEKLMNLGIKGIITDLDNTLIEWDRELATPELIEWLREMEAAGIQVIVASNNDEERVKRFAEPLDLPYLFRAKKPLLGAFKEAMRQMHLKPQEVMMIGDQMLTDMMGANRLKLHTILVKPVAKSDGFVTKFNRAIERRVYKYLAKKGIPTWEEQ